MKQNFSFIYKFVLGIGDTVALLLSFTLAYILRVSLDPRPIPEPVRAIEYIGAISLLLPLWLGIFYILDLYSRRVYERRPKEAGRLLVGAFLGVLLLVAFDFFSNQVLFPAKLIPVYAGVLSFVILWVVRTGMRWLRLYLHQKGYGVVKVLLVGNSEATYYIAKYLNDNIQSGYTVVGIIARKEFIYESYLHKQYRSVVTGIKESSPHTIIQTDTADLDTVYNASIEHHLDYQLMPSHEAILTAKSSTELLGAYPLINVHTTPLIGWGRVVKRAIDIITSICGIILTLPLWIAISAINKLSDPRSKIFYKQRRLTRFKKPIYIYKFRTHNRTYNGLSPEEAFKKMGRLDLLEQYRANGDQLEDDPRETRFGRLLRRTSLDELPQLFNVLRGDISLVGPRALVPAELEDYEFKSLILSVKSGLTGLAQISGRKDISFEERRKLDMYYVQNWSVLMDAQIIIRTIFMVLTGRGAR